MAPPPGAIGRGNLRNDSIPPLLLAPLEPPDGPLRLGPTDCKASPAAISSLRMDKAERWRRDDALPFQEIQGQAVIVCPARQELHQLDETATFLWNRLERPCAVADLAEALCGEFEVEPGQAERDVRAFLTDIEKKGLAVRA